MYVLPTDEFGESDLELIQLVVQLNHLNEGVAVE